MIKLKKDVFKLIKLKKEKCNNYDSIKEKMLRENYNLLEKCLGELPFTFDSGVLFFFINFKNPICSLYIFKIWYN